jgi:bla regulator protein BlaR1
MNALIEIIWGCLHHAALTALFFDAWLKSLAVLAVAGAMCFVLRRAAAATRHWIWFLALASLPCLLLLSAVPNGWHRPLWSVSTGFNSGNDFSLTLNLAPDRDAPNLAPGVPPTGTAPASTGEVRAGSRHPIAAHFSASLLVLGVMVWLAGIVTGLLYVLAGQVQLHRFARNALSLETSDWALLLREASDKLRLRRPVRLWQSIDNPMPLTWGWRRPVVLLPADATSWPSERRRIVLLHELAHAKRWDCLRRW